MTRLASIPALGLVAAATLSSGLASAQQPPAPGIPAAATTPPPPPPAQPSVAGAATAISGVTPEYVNKPDFKAPRKPTGWDSRVAVGGTASFANNSNVAGQISGSSFSFGLKLDAGLDYNNGSHEWRNSLGLGAGITRTPVIDEFVKTSDSLNLETIYLYHIVDWFGPFVRFQFGTSMFPGRDVRAGKATYQFIDEAGNKVGDPITPAGSNCTPDAATGLLPTNCHTSYSLSDGFRPMTFKESIGLFVQPYQSDPLTIELRAGAGAQEVIANNQIAVADKSDTPEIELKHLVNTNQIGAELALSFWGTLVDKRVIYKVNADAMTPFVHPKLATGDDRSAFQLTNVQIDATLSFKLVEWASLDYQLKALRQPQVLDAFQVQNALLLTFGLSYGSSPAAPPAPPPPPPPPPSSTPAPTQAAPTQAPAAK